MDLLSLLSHSLSGRYAIEKPLARGGMGAVYQAVDLRHQRSVAIKVQDPALALVIGTDRFAREIEVVARLNHPHILPLLDSGTLPLPNGTACPFYVMPLMEGETLRDRLTRLGRLPWPEAVRLTAEIAAALDYAHRHGVIHRDVKPENILLHDEQAIIADFGIARALDQASGEHLTGSGVSLGTPAYMSPEQLFGIGAVDARSDVYGLGNVAYEMLAGTPPFDDQGDPAGLKQRLSQSPRLELLPPELPRGVRLAIGRALAFDPKDRFATAAAFRSALVESPGGEGIGVRRRWAAVAGAVAALTAVALLGLTLVRGWRSSNGTPITSLAISPLAGGDSATVYLSDGIHMAVTDLLRRLPQLTVIAPSLVRQRMAQEPGLDLQSLGDRLGVAAVLTWELRRTPDSLHLRTELLRTSDGRLLWGQTYDRPFTDLLALQSEIARTISDSLRLQLTGIDVANLARQQTSDVEAWDLYLQGRHLYYRASLLGGRRVREDTDSILRLAQRILSRDPNFAGGHLLLSWYYSTMALRGLGRPFAALLDTSMAAARRATQLDSTFGDPWADLATPALWLTDDWSTALENVRRAVRLNPNHAQAHQMLAVYFAEIEGNVDSGLIHARRAAALEPLPYFFNTLGDVYMRARRYDSAIAVLRPVFEADPGAPGPRGRLIRSYERLGRYAEAIAVRRRSPDSTDAVALEKGLGREGVRGYRRALSGILERKIDSLIRLRSAPADPVRDTFPPLIEGRIAALYAQRGSWNRAMDWVLAEHQRRPKRFRLFLTNPDFDSLRLDPRFMPLVRREGLESFLR